MKKILVVDDEPDVRLSISQVLELSGYTVVQAVNGVDCLDKLQETVPDLIVLDIMMPKMNGWDVAAQIKGHPKWKDIPIVFLTAKGDDVSIGMGNLAAVDYIVKPFDIMDFMQRIEKILIK